MKRGHHILPGLTQRKPTRHTTMNIRYFLVSTLPVIIILITSHAATATADRRVPHLESKLLCSQCSKCDTSQCPPTESYPHMTAWDDSLIAGALQSDYVDAHDRGVYSVPNIKGGDSKEYNSYYGWKSTSGSASGYHRFSNYMDKCSGGGSYLTVDKHGKVSLRSLSSLESSADADWKSFNPPKKYNHREFRFWKSASTGKCLTVFGGKGKKRTVGVSDCKFNGSNPYQLFAFRFHYHFAFCCCGVHNG